MFITLVKSITKVQETVANTTLGSFPISWINLGKKIIWTKINTPCLNYSRIKKSYSHHYLGSIKPIVLSII